MRKFFGKLKCVLSVVLYFILHSLPIISPILHLIYVNKKNSVKEILEKTHSGVYIVGYYQPIIYIESGYEIDKLPKKILKMQVENFDVKANKLYLFVKLDKELLKLGYYNQMQISFKNDEWE